MQAWHEGRESRMTDRSTVVHAHRGSERPGTLSDTGSETRPATLSAELLDIAQRVPGFMPVDEGLALHRAAMHHLAREGSERPLALEIGSYCGKSTLYLAAATRACDGLALTLDHHRGSEEHQPGWEYHDPSFVDPHTGLLDTASTFRRTLADAGLENDVVALVGSSVQVASFWRTPVNVLFIDGGHTDEAATTDYEGFAPWVRQGGALVLHDVFPNPEDGGQAPYRIYCRALESGQFEEAWHVGSMRVLRRVADSLPTETGS